LNNFILLTHPPNGKPVCEVDWRECCESNQSRHWPPMQFVIDDSSWYPPHLCMYLKSVHTHTWQFWSYTFFCIIVMLWLSLCSTCVCKGRITH